MRFIANTLSLNAELKRNSARSSFLFTRSTSWFYHVDIWMGTPTNFLSIDQFSSEDTPKTTSRGRFEKVSDMELLVFNDDPVKARFIMLLQDKDGLPILPDGFIGIDINHPGENTGTESVEMRFIAANFEEHIYAFGFAASDAGETDTGIFIATNNRKQALLCYNVAKAAQRLHGYRECLKDFIPKIKSEIISVNDVSR